MRWADFLIYKIIWRLQQNKTTVCHSERREARAPTEVELLRVERSEQAKVQGVAAAGYGLKFWWLAMGMLHRYKSHPNSEPYPIVAIAPRFCSVIHSAKLRLQKPLRDFLRSE